jgi:hypothetical protein
MLFDIPAQPLLIKIASEPKSKADRVWQAQKWDVLAPREPSRIGGKALALPIMSELSVCAANHPLRLTFKTTGAWLALA